MRQLLPRALDRLDRELDDGLNGWRVVLAVLKLAGVDIHNLGEVGPDDVIGVLNAETEARVKSIEAQYGPTDYERAQALVKLDQLAASLPREVDGTPPLALPEPDGDRGVAPVGTF